MRNAGLTFPASGLRRLAWRAGRTSRGGGRGWKARALSIDRQLRAFRKRRRDMADLRCNFVGIRSTNPSGWRPAADGQGLQRQSAFEPAGAVVGVEGRSARPADRERQRPPLRARCWVPPEPGGFNNIELITDRMLEDNLREIRQVKRDWPDRALAVSLMVAVRREGMEADPADGRGYRATVSS